jgi:hypothetical protein
MELEPQERTHTNQGTVYVFANVYMYPEKPGSKKYGVYSGIGGWIGLPVTAGLDLNDKFGAIGAAMAKAAGLQTIPQGGELNVFRIFE